MLPSVNIFITVDIFISTLLTTERSLTTTAVLQMSGLVNGLVSWKKILLKMKMIKISFSLIVSYSLCSIYYLLLHYRKVIRKQCAWQIVGTFYTLRAIMATMEKQKIITKSSALIKDS